MLETKKNGPYHIFPVFFLIDRVLQSWNKTLPTAVCRSNAKSHCINVLRKISTVMSRQQLEKISVWKQARDQW